MRNSPTNHLSQLLVASLAIMAVGCSNRLDTQADAQPGLPADAQPGLQSDAQPECSAVQAAFSADSVSGVPPLTVHFTDESSGAVSAWAWDLDGDGVTDSTEQNPTHIYTEAGLYTVALTVSGSDCSDHEVKEAFIAAGALFYVAKNGDDSNPGTEDAPWQTLSKAAETLVEGDTVYVKAGTYNEWVRVQNSGTRFFAYPGDEVIIDGSGIVLGNWWGLFEVSGLSNVRVSGFRVQNSSYAGIFVGQSSHVVVDHNHTFNTRASGVLAWEGDHITIDSNDVELACTASLQEHISVALVDTFEIKYNEVHVAGEDSDVGIDSKHGSSHGKVYRNHVHDLDSIGIYVDAYNSYTHDIDVFENVVHNCGSGLSVAAENGEDLERVRIFNNLVYDNVDHGFVTGDWGSSPAVLHDITIANNTFARNRTCIHFSYHSLEYLDNIIVRNNICSHNTDWQIFIRKEIQSGLGNQITVSHNLLSQYTDNGDNEIGGAAYVTGDPAFVDGPANDFRLTADSPAIDSGTGQDAPAVDYDGNPRPALAGYDIGAFELQP